MNDGHWSVSFCQRQGDLRLTYQRLLIIIIVVVIIVDSFADSAGTARHHAESLQLVLLSWDYFSG